MGRRNEPLHGHVVRGARNREAVQPPRASWTPADGALQRIHEGFWGDGGCGLLPEILSHGVLSGSMGLVDPDARPMRIPFGQSWLDADLIAARRQGSTIIFAHGSGSGRRSPRNRQVAARLSAHGFGTLLLDLLTESEARNDEITAEHRFNIPLLTERLLVATDWLIAKPESEGIPIGYFGASTGGAVAMIAAAQRPESVGAIVLRGARSDLGDSAAPCIRCPTLLIAGENDALIRRANERTLELLRCEKQLEVIPDASHLFEEPGALETVAERTSEWFGRYLSSAQK